MQVLDFLKRTFKINDLGFMQISEIRPHIECVDGFTMSVQASQHHYCHPREDLPNGNYLEVEIGFPSADEELIREYAEDQVDLTETVYGYVPGEVVEAVIEKHGGIKYLIDTRTREKIAWVR